MSTHDDICEHVSTYVTNLSYTNLSYPALSSSVTLSDDRPSSEARSEAEAEETDRTDDDDEKRKLFQRIEERSRSAGIIDKLNDVIFRKLTEQYSEAEIIDAIDKAGMNNGQHYNYVFTILANQKAGIGKQSEPLKPVKVLNGQNYKQRDYSEDEIQKLVIEKALQAYHEADDD